MAVKSRFVNAALYAALWESPAEPQEAGAAFKRLLFEKREPVRQTVISREITSLAGEWTVS